MFSPGGRLLQVEYARECPQSGPLSVAIRCRDGIVFGKAMAVEPELGFEIPLFWPVTSKIAYVANGNLGDMFFLRDMLAQRRRTSTPDVERLIRATLHEHAVRTDVRPLALLLLLGSVEGGRPRLVGFDVTGSEFECDAWAIGTGNPTARSRLMHGSNPSDPIIEAVATVDRVYGRRAHKTLLLRTRKRPATPQPLKEGVHSDESSR